MPWGGGRTVDPHWGTNVTWTESFWDPVSLGLNVWVALSLGPKVGGLNIKSPDCCSTQLSGTRKLQRKILS